VASLAWDVLGVVCAVVGALTLWTLAAGAVVSIVLRRNRSRSTQRADAMSPESNESTVHSLLNRRARSWAEVPAWVKDDREWAAAVVLLGSDGVATRTEPFVDFGARRIDWVNLRLDAADWAPAERLLVEVAYDLAYAQYEPDSAEAPPHVALADLADLGDPGFELLHAAVNARRGA